jgi:membrane protease YdiL (CAAX protease family)
VSVFPFFKEPAGYSFDAIFQSQEILARLEGAWWFFALFVITAVFCTIWGRGFSFGGVAAQDGNRVRTRELGAKLYTLRSLSRSQPWGILDNILTGFLYPFPAYRYRSTWMSIILHSAQSGFFAFLVLGVVLGLA